MRPAPVALAAALLLALAGCVPSGPHGSPSPHSSSTPVFASDADALKAAEAAYAAYLKVSDQVAMDGGVNPERFATVVTASWLPTETAAAAQFQSSGRHQTGTTRFSRLSIEQLHEDGESASLVAYTCLDLSETRILDASGADVTPVNRQSLFSVEASFVTNPRSASGFLVSSNEPWSGKSVC